MPFWNGGNTSILTASGEAMDDDTVPRRFRRAVRTGARRLVEDNPVAAAGDD
jgi:hypothetical protein